jgi:hypothetical protein
MHRRNEIHESNINKYDIPFFTRYFRTLLSKYICEALVYTVIQTCDF